MKLGGVNIKTILNIIGSSFLTTICYFLGGYDLALQSLIIVIIIDYISGLLKAIVDKKISSKIGLKGIIKKVGYLLIVTLSVLIDKNFGSNGLVRNAVIYFFISNEGISILENWSGLGLPIPNTIKNALDQLKDKEVK